MKFMHIADVHLFAEPDSDKPYGAKRGLEIRDTFAAAVGKAEEDKTDLLLVAGDLFHRQPLMRELKEVNYLFGTLTHTKVVLIAGNHDHMKRDSYFNDFPWNDNVTMLSGETMQCVSFPELNTEVYGFSYHSREITQEKYNDAKPRDNGCIHILLAHGGDAKHIPIRTEALSRLTFEYIALGHIHRPALVVPGKAAYSGALEPIDRGDVGRHGYIAGEIERAGEEAKLTFVPFAKRCYYNETLTVDEDTTEGALCDEMRRISEDKGTQNIYGWTLEGYRSPDMSFDIDVLSEICNTSSITDNTQPAYRFDELLKQHEADIIGMYINSFLENGADPETLKKDPLAWQALYIGVQALLEA